MEKTIRIVSNEFIKIKTEINMEICRSCRIIVTLSFALVLITSSQACFIRNCPPGGKRSMDLLPRASRQVRFYDNLR